MYKMIILFLLSINAFDRSDLIKEYDDYCDWDFKVIENNYNDLIKYREDRDNHYYDDYKRILK